MPAARNEDLHTMPDERLMLAYSMGNTDAFDVLYARHEGPLFRFVRRVLGQDLSAQADEVFQDCWLRIVQARQSFAPDQGRWKTWAYAIAHHAAIDRLRSAGREISMPGWDDAADGAESLDWIQAQPDMHQPAPDDQTHWRAAGAQLLHCLEGLPAAQRAAFLLHHEDGASLEHMAAALGVGFETVKSRLRYAMTRLRGCMQAYLGGWRQA